MPFVMFVGLNPSTADETSDDPTLVVAAWGNDGAYLERSEQVKEFLPNLYCLKLNKSGEPAHPLYQAAELKPVPIAI